MTLWDMTSLLLGGLLGIALPFALILFARWLRRLVSQLLRPMTEGVPIARNRIR